MGEREVERKLHKRKQEFSQKLNKVTSEVDDMLESNREVQKLRRQIKEKPLVYAALAFALGMALGGMCRRKD
ncbi:hypothetical protein GF415_00755 [Candidatus Micrarchaeota archaeon]|nr:hypothetical protein [Candidatus Micrarchaeota archaeon]